jgi:hypothetical protein
VITTVGGHVEVPYIYIYIFFVLLLILTCYVILVGMFVCMYVSSYCMYMCLIIFFIPCLYVGLFINIVCVFKELQTFAPRSRAKLPRCNR